MSIFDKKIGEKVVFKYPNNGYPEDIEHAKKHLKVGQEYTILDKNIRAQDSQFQFEECMLWFNAVHFR